jgi:sulfatase modifying factor 1
MGPRGRSRPRALAALLLAGAGLAACSDRAPSAPIAPAASTSAEAPPPTAATVGAVAPAIATALPIASASAVVPTAVSAGAGERAPCPEGMALVQRFCIDRFEAELVAPDADGGLVQLAPNQRPPSDVRFEARSVPGVMPQGYVNRVEAASACQNAGKRLCSMREWRRACEGGRGWHWPYGARAVVGTCNHEKGHVLSLRHGADPRRWTYEMFNDPALDVEPGFLARTGEYAGCTSAEDVHDLVGNLHEWVSDTVDAELAAKLEAEEVERNSQPWKTGNGVFMGGFFSTADQHGPGCTFTTIAHEPTYHDYSIGFRCCAAADLPPPARRQATRAPR